MFRQPARKPSSRVLHDGEHFVEVFGDSVSMLEEVSSNGLRAGTWLDDG